MADDPGHEALMKFLEILMNSPSPLTISQLAGRFGSRDFSSEMRQAAGGNEAGLKKFLVKYPSLFTVNGNLVSNYDGSANLGNNTFRENSPASSSSGFSLPDVSVETEAVQYFRARISRKGERWIPIRSLAGHLSQACQGVRECVGPQNDFRDWLLTHPLIFDVQGELVSIKDNITVSAVTPSSEVNVDFRHIPTVPSGTPRMKRRPKSLDIASSQPPVQKSVGTPGTSAKPGPITMTANEYKAIMFIKNIIEKKGPMSLLKLTGHFSQSPESLRNTIGWQTSDLENFVRMHSNIFEIYDETVSVIKSTRLNVVITGSRPPVQPTPVPTVRNRNGKIYHMSKLWGIIDLGKHEHVFIDRTIFGKQIDDLSKLFNVGATVCFDAIPAAKGSRARWRATKVWTENESIEDLIDRIAAKLNLPLDRINVPMTPVHNVDEELRRFIPELNDSDMSTPLLVGGMTYAFSDAAPSGAGVIPVWNFKPVELAGMKDVDDLDLDDSFDSDTAPSVSMVAERYYMNQSVLGDSPRSKTKAHDESQSAAVNGMNNNDYNELQTSLLNGKGCSETHSRKCKMVNAACQTITTGEILATQLFHDEF